MPQAGIKCYEAKYCSIQDNITVFSYQIYLGVTTSGVFLTFFFGNLTTLITFSGYYTPTLGPQKN